MLSSLAERQLLGYSWYLGMLLASLSSCLPSCISGISSLLSALREAVALYDIKQISTTETEVIVLFDATAVTVDMWTQPHVYGQILPGRGAEHFLLSMSGACSSVASSWIMEEGLQLDLPDNSPASEREQFGAAATSGAASSENPLSSCPAVASMLSGCPAAGAANSENPLSSCPDVASKPSGCPAVVQALLVHSPPPRVQCSSLGVQCSSLAGPPTATVPAVKKPPPPATGKKPPPAVPQSSYAKVPPMYSKSPPPANTTGSWDIARLHPPKTPARPPKTAAKGWTVGTPYPQS
jgi:hypothetical protein